MHISIQNLLSAFKLKIQARPQIPCPPLRAVIEVLLICGGGGAVKEETTVNKRHEEEGENPTVAKTYIFQLKVNSHNINESL